MPDDLQAEIDSVQVRWNAPLTESLRVAATTGHLLLDLKAKLLVNESSTAFVTSDCPVVMFNQWCRGWGHGGVTGFASSGLQVWLPLSPHHVLLLFDEEVYSVGKQSSNIVRVARPRDVKGVNALQLLGVESNLYYRHDDATAAAIDALPFHWQSDRLDAIRLHRAQSDEDGSHLLHTFQRQPDVRLDVSFVRVRAGKASMKLSERARSYRQEALKADRFFGHERSSASPPVNGPRRWRVIDTD